MRIPFAGVNTSLRRIAYAFGALAALVLIGAVAYFILGHGRWTFSECLYMTVITITTVGFAELTNMREVPGARALTVTLILSGVGTIAYVQGNVTALLVEGVIGQVLRRNRMRKAIAALRNHIVVAGSGSTGKHVSFQLHGDDSLLYVIGDATEDHVLIEAGVTRARGVVAALTHDKDNLYVTLSARSLNPTARIVAKVTEDEAGPKMLKAGATSVVSPTMIGGMRMASELIRPEVNEFLDQMLRDKDKNLRLEEVPIPTGSPFAGHALREAPIRRDTKVLVVAVRDQNREFVYNPEPEFVLEEGSTLIVLGDAVGVAKLRKILATT